MGGRDLSPAEFEFLKGQFNLKMLKIELGFVISVLVLLLVCVIAKLIIHTRRAKRYKKSNQESSNRDEEFIGVQAYAYEALDESQGEEEEVRNMFTLL